MPTEPMSPSDQPAGRVVTVKDALFTVWLFTVTENGPDDAPEGTVAVMLASLQFRTVALVALSEIVLLPWVAPNPVPVIVTSDPTTPDVGDRLVMLSVSTTVKEIPLLATPLVLTTTLPVVAPVGTGTAILVALQLVGVDRVPLNAIVPVPCVAPKFNPVIVMDVPTTPEVADRLLILGAGTTVKLTPLLAPPATVTTTFPVVAPDGTGTPMLIALQLVGVAAVPLNFTVLEPWLDPKVVPVMVTGAPTAPVVGERLVMPGRTVKAEPLLATPLTVTTTFPVVAPLGTVVVMLVALQVPTVAVVPLNVTVLVPCVAPNVVPVIVTAVPTAPDGTDRLVIAGATVKFTPLLATPLAFTTTFPVVAPFGTVTAILDAPQVVTEAVVPLNVTVPVPCELPKFDPVTVTAAPTAPVVIDRLVMLGAGTTVKFTPLLG